jgi:2-polyprenyl-3-methyl-5-hydroxy-6-metoxy-1,4-benzoquinol methylase
MAFQDNEDYWVRRHEDLKGSLASVGVIGTPEHENRQRYARKKRRIVSLLRSLGNIDLQGKTVLDAGCGIGMVSELLFALGATVHGIDASPVAAAEARDRASPPPFDPNNFKVGSLLDFKFPGQFNFVFCLDVLYHIVDDDNWQQVVRNLATHTAAGGLLVIVDQVKQEQTRPADHVCFRTKAMYDDLLADLGAEQWTPSDAPEFLVYRFPGTGTQEAVHRMRKPI